MSTRKSDYDYFLGLDGAEKAFTSTYMALASSIEDLSSHISLEFFEGTQIFDILDSRFVAIARDMSSTIFTIDLRSEFIRKNRLAFSFDGPFLSVDCSYDDELTENVAQIEIGDLDELDRRELISLQKLLAKFPNELYLQAHHPLTYLDFVKIIRCPGEYSEPLLISGARDHHIFISTFSSHKVIADIIDDDDWKATPRCCTWDGRRYVYVGCDSGVVVVIDMTDPQHKNHRIHLGDVRITSISVSPDGKTLAVLNADNMVFQMSMPDEEILAVDELDEKGYEVMALNAPNPTGIITSLNLDSLTLQYPD